MRPVFSDLVWELWECLKKYLTELDSLIGMIFFRMIVVIVVAFCISEASHNALKHCDLICQQPPLSYFCPQRNNKVAWLHHGLPPPLRRIGSRIRLLSFCAHAWGKAKGRNRILLLESRRIQREVKIWSPPSPPPTVAHLSKTLHLAAYMWSSAGIQVQSDTSLSAKQQ